MCGNLENAGRLGIRKNLWEELKKKRKMWENTEGILWKILGVIPRDISKEIAGGTAGKFLAADFVNV